MNVLTVGGAMVDTIAIIRSDRIERMTMRNADADFLLLEEGRKIEASEISNHVGGGAVNAAVAMSRLGHDVSALVKLGRDQRADTVRDRLASEQVETRWIAQTDEAPTGASVMVASHERNATIFTFRGANTCLVTDDLRPEAFATDVVYITALSNASADRFGDIVHHAKTTGALVATNPGTRQLSARSGVFFDNLAAIDILCLNAAEAGVLVPQLVPRCGEGGAPLEMPEGGSAPRLARFGFVTQDFEMSLTRFMCELRAAGIPRVLITDGTDGAYLADETGITYCPALPADVVGTAGAGDAFASTVVAALAEGTAPGEALRAGACNAASVVGAADTQTGLLDRDTLRMRLAETKERFAVTHFSV